MVFYFQQYPLVLPLHLYFFNYNRLIKQYVFTIRSLIDTLVHSITYYQVHGVLEEIMEKLPEEFNMAELMEKAEERTPYQVVALQECERMNFLTQEIRSSLHELNLGLKVRGL